MSLVKYRIPSTRTFTTTLKQKLIVISARSLIFNMVTWNEFYIPALVYTDTHDPHATLTANSILLLRLLTSVRPSRSNLRILPLEHEDEHWSLLVLDYRSRTYYTLDPSTGYGRYPFMNHDVHPILQDILSQHGWDHDTTVEVEYSNGPMSITDDNHSYMWSCVIAHMALRTDPITAIDDLNDLSESELESVIEEFYAYWYAFLVGKQLDVIYRRINKLDLCYNSISEIADTVSSASYYRDVNAQRILDNEIERHQSNCQSKNLTSESV